MVNKQKKQINFLVVTYGLVRVTPCISTMSLYVGSRWFCYSVSNSLSNHFNPYPQSVSKLICSVVLNVCFRNVNIV